MRFMGLNFGTDSGSGLNGFYFTERVRKVLANARDEAAQLRHEYVGTEHLLLGLLRDTGGVSATVLANLGVDAEAVRATLLQVVRQGPREVQAGPDLPYTSRAKKTLELAMTEARDLHHTYVGTEHLLLGLVAEGKGIAAQVLTGAGCTLSRARAETHAILGDPVDEQARTADAPPTRADEYPPKAERRPAAKSADQLAGVAVDRLMDRLSARAVAITSAANLEAVKRGSRAVRAEHLLRALLAHDEGSAAAVLQRLGADRTKLLAHLDREIEPSTEHGGPETRLDSSELLTLLSLAEMEREYTDAPRVATHHLLLAVMTQSAIGNAVFASTGITADRVREEAARISG